MSFSLRNVSLAVLILVVVPDFAFADDAAKIFNGKDLTGWIKRGGDATYRRDKCEVYGKSAPKTSNTFHCTPKE